MGDEIRKFVKEMPNLPFYNDLKAKMQAGQLINAGLAWAILERKLRSADTTKGFILDGFPRTRIDAEILSISGVKLDLVVNLKQSEEVVKAKLLGRRVCRGCGANYNVAEINFDGYQLPGRQPKAEGKCDLCHDKLMERADDTEETIAKRLKVYKDETAPLEEYYGEQGKLFDFVAYKGVDDYPNLLKQLRERLNTK
jgi:adenylate kinase